MKKTVAALLLIAALAVGAVAYAQTQRPRPPKRVTPTLSSGLIYGDYLIVLRDNMVNIYHLRDLPRLTLINAAEIPTSVEMAGRMMGGGGDMMGRMGMMGGRGGRASGTKGKQPRKAAATTTSEHGRAVYLSQNCSACHRIAGKGGTIGPDLSHVGSRRSAAWIAKKITDPRATNPSSVMPPHQLSHKDLDALAGYLAGLK
jgi:mono/diheme cytochrome c family protein